MKDDIKTIIIEGKDGKLIDFKSTITADGTIELIDEEKEKKLKH